MNFYVMTLFPEMVEQGMRTGILGRAMEKGLLSLEAVNIRDYTEDKHKKVDDYPYGGGAGMLLQAQPVFRCYQEIAGKIGSHGFAGNSGNVTGGQGGQNGPSGPSGPNEKDKEFEGNCGEAKRGPDGNWTGKKREARVIYLTPQGERFCQQKAKELAKEENLVFLCGHYEGIDERVLEEIVTDYISIGDYVLTGGELAAMVLMDSIARLVPGVLHNEASADFETFHNDLLEYPQYSRPEVWHGKAVPEVLLTGDHRKIEAWRLEQSEMRTKTRRPDMYGRYSRKQHYIQLLQKKGKLLHMDMIESLRRGRGEIVQADEEGMLIRDLEAKVYMAAVFEEKKAWEIFRQIPEGTGGWQYVLHQKCLLDPMGQFLAFSGLEFSAEESIMPVYMAVYTQRNALPLRMHAGKNIEFRALGVEFLGEVMEHYRLTDDRAYMEERLQSGNIYGAFIAGRLAGFAGIHQEGSLGMLEVFGEYRRQGIGQALETFMVNLHLSMGYTPYGMVGAKNHASLGLQGKMGLCISKEKIYWVAT